MIRKHRYRSGGGGDDADQSLKLDGFGLFLTQADIAEGQMDTHFNIARIREIATPLRAARTVSCRETGMINGSIRLTVPRLTPKLFTNKVVLSY